jgi:hypothetical protein
MFPRGNISDSMENIELADIFRKYRKYSITSRSFENRFHIFEVWPFPVHTRKISLPWSVYTKNTVLPCLEALTMSRKFPWVYKFLDYFNWEPLDIYTNLAPTDFYPTPRYTYYSYTRHFRSIFILISLLFWLFSFGGLKGLYNEN